MLRFLPALIQGVLGALIFVLNTVFWCLILFLFVPLKVCIPNLAFRRWCTQQMTKIAQNWTSGNNFEMDVLYQIQWQVEGLGQIHRDRSYLIFANHQSWVDIVVIQKIFSRRIPFPRFFLKQQLLYVPFLGAAWWALDFPFMKRYSKSYLEKHPEKRGEDLATTRRACARFQGSPISILNFLEGTRLTKEKHLKQKSPYRHLLLPKAGGTAFVLEAMGRQFHSILDVTIQYPDSKSISLWDMFCGRLNKIYVRVNEIPIPAEFLSGNYLEDAVYRQRFQDWIRGLWENKDRVIGEIHVS
jgi:1-acyl-sn-glycerol-3-phosphate acyltransferase